MDEHFMTATGHAFQSHGGTSTRQLGLRAKAPENNKWCTCPLLVSPTIHSFIARRTFKWRSLSHRKNYKLNINIGTVVMNLSFAPK